MEFKRHNRGFTIIEVLVVISILGLLASIIFTNANKTRRTAEYSRILQEFGQMEKAFIIWNDERGWRGDGLDAGWELDNSLGGSEDPSVNTLLSLGLDRYLPVVPDTFFSGSSYHYDNDGDLHNHWDTHSNTCTPNVEDRGVNLILEISGFSQMSDAYEAYAWINKQIDPQDPAGQTDGGTKHVCGKVRFHQTGNTAYIYYGLSKEFNDF